MGAGIRDGFSTCSSRAYFFFTKYLKLASSRTLPAANDLSKMIKLGGGRLANPAVLRQRKIKKTSHDLEAFAWSPN